MAVRRDAPALDFLVRRDDIRQCRVAERPAPEPGPGEALLAVERFALTSNNVSYALAGDLLGYWGFFPPAEAAEGWGRIPAMGFGRVLSSRTSGVAEGERFFGFYPMATHLVVRPAPGRGRFVDAAPHRAGQPAAYVSYVRTSDDPFYAAEREDHELLLRGLFLTSFLIDDLLRESDFFGARAVLLTSASSKTAIALAFLLSERTGALVVGLTSERNAAFVEGLECYDQVVRYEELPSLASDVAAVVVDMAGDAELTRAIHRHFGDSLRYDCTVGATHWQRAGPPGEVPGPAPAFFFAPERLEKRAAEWGAGELERRMAEAYRRFLAFTDSWLRIVRRSGADALERCYREALEGRADPAEGRIVSLW